jgi:hypothetical protein
MKRGGLFFAALLLISGVMRFAGSGAMVSAPQEKEGTGKTNSKGAEKPSAKTPYLKEFASAVSEFYGVPESDSAQANSIASYLAPLKASSDAAKREVPQFVITIVPDPVHTRLGLSFDRHMEAIQQAAQMKGYAFDRAILPWSRTPRSEPEDAESRQKQKDEQAQRESLPGLLVFRPGRESAAASSTGPLFVLVVSETPTAGLNKDQFRNAVQAIREIHAASSPAQSANLPQLLILGPSFSGSLESLQQSLNEPGTRQSFRETFIYSGTVTDRRSMCWFEQRLNANEHFTSFQENGDYARHQFLLFAANRGYTRDAVAVLSEDDTVFGASHTPANSVDDTAEIPKNQTSASQASTALPLACRYSPPEELNSAHILQLHFPREISYFRSEYQKESAAQPQASSNPSGLSPLPMDMAEGGSDDDAVPPYATAQTALSQEAVMIGIVSELQKHGIKFTMLLATDPLDELFLAGYLRKGYPQGRVVVTAPDLLFSRQGDPQLSGVLGLNAYSLISGLSDRLCRQEELVNVHEDRLFASSLNVGTFNAMAGLLSVDAGEKRGWLPVRKSGDMLVQTVPYAPYADYGTPGLFNASPDDVCQERPLLWLTMLGRDGFWPIAALSGGGLTEAHGQDPIAYLRSDESVPNTLNTAFGPYGFLSSAELPESKLGTPPAWNIAYCLCLILLAIHALLSWTGSVLADSEARAQFARTTDCRGTLILALGAFALASAFVLVMCTRSPLVDWSGFPGLTELMWLPYLLFVVMTIWDFGNLRHEPLIAALFTLFVCGMTWFQVFLTLVPWGPMRVYWSSRMLHLTSGVSPVLPVLLLMAAGYWWMWISMRGVCLVDLRRPRLPEKQDLPVDSYRISDNEGEELRKTAHPFFFARQVLLPVVGLALVSLTALDRTHPVQTIEGEPYDWGFTVLLGLMVAVFLGCLLKLVWTWLKCRQVLAGLDRTPLRAAFSRMKDLSWHSFWNPGGSTLRETYKVMSRALENLTRLLAIVENWNTPLTDNARWKLKYQMRKTLDMRQGVFDAYVRIFAYGKKNGDTPETARRKKRISLLARLRVALRRLAWFLNPANVARLARRLWLEKQELLHDDFMRGWRLRRLMKRVELLQKEMAKTGAILIRDALKPCWDEEEEMAVSSDDRIAKPRLTVFRAMAEEYAALIYVNFLVSVLLRIRTLVLCAGGMYIFIVMAMNTYPFEPHSALQTLTVLLLLVMGGAVGYVYAEMHREVILSRLTSTEPGELGLDFWIKFGSAAALPVFSLLAAQFPSINQFLFSWLEPALQAMK